MLLKRLFSYAVTILLFFWVFFLSATIITIQFVAGYALRMFDLPMDVIYAMIETNENKNKEV